MSIAGIPYNPINDFAYFKQFLGRISDSAELDSIIQAAQVHLNDILGHHQDTLLVIQKNESTRATAYDHSQALRALISAATQRKEGYLQHIERQARSQKSKAKAKTASFSNKNQVSQKPLTGSNVPKPALKRTADQPPARNQVPQADCAASAQEQPSLPVLQETRATTERASPALEEHKSKSKDATEMLFLTPKKVCRSSPPATPAPPEVSNSFSSLQEEMELTVQAPECTAEKVPIIYLDTPEDPTDVITKLSKLNEVELTVHTLRSALKFKASSFDAHTKIIQFLDNGNLPYRIQTTRDSKPRKFVIKGIPHATEIKNVETWLQAVNQKPNRVTSLYKHKEGQRPPPFVVAFPRTQDVSLILSIKKLGFYPVKVENLRPNKKRKLVCYRCQAGSHSSHGCKRREVCIYCAGFHASKACDRPDPSQLSCARCKGSHSARDSRCPALAWPTLPKKKLQQSTGPTGSKPELHANAVPSSAPKIKPGRSFAQAAAGSAPPAEGKAKLPVLTESSQMKAGIPEFLSAYNIMKSLPEGENRMVAILDAFAKLFAIIA